MTAYDFELGEERLRAVLERIQEAQRMKLSCIQVSSLHMDTMIGNILASRYDCHVEPWIWTNGGGGMAMWSISW